MELTMKEVLAVLLSQEAMIVDSEEEAKAVMLHLDVENIVKDANEILKDWNS